MQPLLVTLEPSDKPAGLITHSGQEFNLVLEGTVIVVIGDKEFTLTAGDSIYFNPTIPHGQRCGGDVRPGLSPSSQSDRRVTPRDESRTAVRDRTGQFALWGGGYGRACADSQRTSAPVPGLSSHERA